MATYTVKVNIAERWIDAFNDNNTRLCMAKATKDASGKEVFNVVTYAQGKLAPTVTITWTDEYAIEASTITFARGATIMPSLQRKAIAFGELYQIRDWHEPVQVFRDETVPQDAIGFLNVQKCSCVLYLKQGGEFVPVYITNGLRSAGEIVLTPLPKVVLWFQNDIKAGTMITTFQGSSMAVNVTPGSPVTIKFNKKGEWEAA